MMAKWLKPICIILIIVIAGGFFYLRVFGSKPFKLAESEVSSVSARLFGEKEIMEATTAAGTGWLAEAKASNPEEAVDAAKFVAMVNEVIVYKKDGGYREFFLKEVSRKEQQINDLIGLGSRKTKTQRETLEKLQTTEEVAAAFIVELSDGKTMTIEVCEPFVVVDGVGYRAKIGPCEELLKLAGVKR